MSEQDFYQEPGTTTAEQNHPEGSSLKAVLVGTGVDIIGTLAFSAMLGVVFAVIWISQGASIEDIEQRAAQAADPSSLLGALGIAGGLLISVVAGFVCARFSIHRIPRDIAILSVISVVFVVATNIQTVSPWANAAMALAGVAALALGGFLGAVSIRKRNARSGQ